MSIDAAVVTDGLFGALYGAPDLLKIDRGASQSSCWGASVRTAAAILSGMHDGYSESRLLGSRLTG
jgi:hypothetical protein